jgi:hypothetical protein
MKRSTAATLGTVWALGLCLAVPARAQDDAFARRYAAALEKSVSAGALSIAFADDRRTFHQGETIALIFQFPRLDVSAFNDDRCPGLGFAEAVFDHADGIVDPQRDVWTNGIVWSGCGLFSGSIAGIAGVVGAPAEEPQPLEIRVNLNQSVRFDRPGTYRFFVADHHVFGPGGPYDSRRRLLVSNVLQLEILPQDKGWQREALAQALRTLESSRDRPARADAARTLSFLGTPQAVQELVRRFSSARTPFGGPYDSDWFDGYWLQGLYGAPDRADVIARMEHELDRTDRYVSWRFVSELSILSLAHRTNARPLDRPAYLAGMRAYSRRRLSALKAVGALDAELTRALGETAEYETALDTLTQGLRYFPVEVARVLRRLKPSGQRHVLEKGWTTFSDAAFTSMLTRIVEDTTDRDGPRDAALRIVYDVNPAHGRRLVLDQLSRQNPTTSIFSTSILPDAELSQLDSTFALAIEHAATLEEYRKAIDRIERYATGSIGSRVKRVYERFPGARTCGAGPVALGYFFRVDPEYAATEAMRVFDTIGRGPWCETGVLPAIPIHPARAIHPALEAFAIDRLRDADAWPVADAAQMLTREGSSAAKIPLLQAFERWRPQWEGRAAQLEVAHPDGVPWDEGLEGVLSESLLEGIAWHLDRPEFERLRALCVTDYCRYRVDSGADESDSLVIYVHAPTFKSPEPQFDVAGVRTWSRQSLRRHLATFPPGTVFTWRAIAYQEAINGPPAWEGRLADIAGEFGRVKVFLERHGMSLQPFRYHPPE